MGRGFFKGFLRFCVTSCMAATLTCAGLNGNAQAGGGETYPNGAESFFAGAAPPPGIHLVNYLYYYNADELKNAKGHDSGLLNDASVYAEVLRLIWISNYQLLGANYGQHLFLLATDRILDFNAPVGPRGKRHYSSVDTPYLIYDPFILTWHLLEGRLHMVFGTDIYVPFSNESERNLTAMGRNFWTIEPVLAATWLPTKELELSAKFMYDFNTRQDNYISGAPVSFDRTPGGEFHVDFNASYAILPELRLGMSGYYYRQVKNDDFHGLNRFPVPLQDALKNMEGDQSQVWALGPGIWYQYQNMMFTLRSQWEFETKNKPEGQNVWCTFVYSFK